MRTESLYATILQADLEGFTGVAPPFQISKIEESNNTKQKIEDNPLEKEEERKNCMFV